MTFGILDLIKKTVVDSKVPCDKFIAEYDGQINEMNWAIVKSDKPIDRIPQTCGYCIYKSPMRIIFHASEHDDIKLSYKSMDDIRQNVIKLRGDVDDAKIYEIRYLHQIYLGISPSRQKAYELHFEVIWREDEKL